MVTQQLAVIIPPSGLAVLLGSLAQINIGALLIAGLIPGLVLAVLYCGLIFAQTRIDPAAAPSYDVAPCSVSERVWLLMRDIAPNVLIIVAVVGSIITGFATPTESGAMGVLAVLLLGLAYRAISWATIGKALSETARVMGMIFLLITASSTFAQLLAFSGASAGLVGSVTALDLGPYQMLAVIVGMILLLGMFMDPVSIMLITLPIFIPIAQSYGYDLIWFALIMLIMLEVSFTTPPFGLLLFVMLAVSPSGTTLSEVSLAALPYILCCFLLVLVLVLLPDLAIWLPAHI